MDSESRGSSERLESNRSARPTLKTDHQMRKQLEDVKEETAPSNHLIYVRQENLSQPIELCFGDGDHKIKIHPLDPHRALRLAADLLEAATRTLAHRK